MAHHAWNQNCKVYVGGLKEEANKYDLEDAFGKIGKVSEGEDGEKEFHLLDIFFFVAPWAI